MGAKVRRKVWWWKSRRRRRNVYSTTAERYEFPKGKERGKEKRSMQRIFHGLKATIDFYDNRLNELLVGLPLCLLLIWPDGSHHWELSKCFVHVSVYVHLYFYLCVFPWRTCTFALAQHYFQESILLETQSRSCQTPPVFVLKSTQTPWLPSSLSLPPFLQPLSRL